MSEKTKSIVGLVGFILLVLSIGYNQYKDLYDHADLYHQIELLKERVN